VLGVDCEGRHILLDGFKRVRCAALLHIHTLPYAAVGQDQAQGILTLLRGSHLRGLTILEEARFVEALSTSHGLAVSEISRQLSRSQGWVSMRLHVVAQTPSAVLEKLLAGEFSTYAYLYLVRPFMRMNPRRGGEIAEFIEAVSGKGLSVREIRFLFQGFMRGSDDFREQVRLGRLALLLNPLRRAGGWSAQERRWLEVLAAVGRQLYAGLGAGPPPGEISAAFAAEAGLLSESVLKAGGEFFERVRRLHAESQRAVGTLPVASTGDGGARDRAAAQGEPQHGAPGDPGAGAAGDPKPAAVAAARGGVAAEAVRGMPRLCPAGWGTLGAGAPDPH
jgi:hypothetical protein